MQIIDFSRDHASPIELFDSIAVSNVRIGGGQGETHVYCVYFKPGGSIGEHPAGYAQRYPQCHQSLADVNGDGAVNAFDTIFFVRLLDRRKQ